MVTTSTPTPAQRAAHRAKYLTGVLWHVGTFVIINGFFWILDLVVGEPGIQWAFWITLFWGFALAFHVLAYLVDGRQIEERTAQRHLADDRRRSTG